MPYNKKGGLRYMIKRNEYMNRLFFPLIYLSLYYGFLFLRHCIGEIS